MADLTALYDETASEEEVVACYQELVDTGLAWHLEGHVGRTADRLLEAGEIALGPEGHRDFYNSYVPSRTEVEPGTKGSPEYVLERSGRDVLEARDRAVEGIVKTVERFDRASDEARAKDEGAV
jgi:hypothetical protein